MGAPLTFRWDGEAMIPLIHCRKQADEQFVIGQAYRMTEYEERSLATHNHEFAWLATAWENLPEAIAPTYPTPEHLRKRALIEAGYFHETAVDAGSHAAAIRVAAAVRSLDEFALVIVQGAFVLIRRAKSQSRRAMKKDEFQKSKSAIMDVVAEMLGVSPDSLEKAAA